GTLRGEYLEKEQMGGTQCAPAVGTTTVRRESFPRRRDDLPFYGHRDSSLYRQQSLPGHA
ncbi:MAG: hypothetical protein EAZ40_07085, partial [Rhodobacterales bacterium]